MAANEEDSPSRPALFRSTVLPLVWLFAVPLFSAWFFGHATERFDAPHFAHLTKLVGEGKLTPQAEAFWREYPPSKICASGDPRLAKVKAQTKCSDYEQFFAGRWVAYGSIALGLVGLALIVLLVGVSRISQRAQYNSFRAGWLLLKLFSLAQVLAQGALLVGLSFWVTALWFNIFVPKLILVVAVLALGAAFLVIKAIFQRVPQDDAALTGKLLPRAEAPELWERIEGICREVDTAPPDQIVVGVDANFFVTEHALVLGDQRLVGRTLFVSLPLLKALERDEADAVLAHEMAHFSGDDTLYSRKLSPLLARYLHYLQALHEGGISLPVFYFMLAYWTLFQLSLSRTSRQRELRADAIAVQQSSADGLARSLLKIAAYCEYRGKVEQEIIESQALNPDLSVAQRVAQGFVSYAGSPALDELYHADPDNFGHPFDSHPPLSARLAAVPTSITPERYRDVVLADTESTWFAAVETGEAIEAALWAEHEAAIGEVQQQLLAYRLGPATDEERAVVEKTFPPQTFAPSRGEVSVSMDYLGFASSDAEAEVAFDQIHEIKVVEQGFNKRQYLKVQLKDGGERQVCLSRLAGDGQPFLAELDRYYGRHLAAVQHVAEQHVAEPHVAEQHGVG